MKLLTKESLPFEIVFKETNSKINVLLSYNKENVIIKINEQTFSFSKNENDFENSIFNINTKYLK